MQGILKNVFLSDYFGKFPTASKIKIVLPVSKKRDIDKIENFRHTYFRKKNIILKSRLVRHLEPTF